MPRFSTDSQTWRRRMTIGIGTSLKT